MTRPQTRAGSGGATFQVPADRETTPGGAGGATGGRASVDAVSFHKSFVIEEYRATLKNTLGLGEEDIQMAADILLECAPLLVEKNIVILDGDHVSSPRAPLPSSAAPSGTPPYVRIYEVQRFFFAPSKV